MMVTLTNSFHNREARVRLGTMTRENARRVSKKLCGNSDCSCGYALSTRGPQKTDDGNKIVIEERPNGTVEIRI